MDKQEYLKSSVACNDELRCKEMFFWTSKKESSCLSK